MKRTLWMFPRNKRRCPPTDVGLVIRALSNALSESEDSSIGSQIAQDALIETFNTLELIEGEQLQHVNSGGLRTYLAYFRQLGLTFRKQL